MKELDFDIVCGLCGSHLKDDETTACQAFNCSNRRALSVGWREWAAKQSSGLFNWSKPFSTG